MSTTALSLRPARGSDAAALANLSSQLSYPVDAETMARNLQQIEAQGAGAVVVACAADDTPIAWMHLRISHALEHGAFAEILGLVVDAAWRSMGVGALLLAHAEAWAREHGVSEIRVRSNVIRERAHGFYRRHGYQERKRQVCFAKGV